MSEKTKKPVYKRWWFWVIVVIIIAAASGGNDESTTVGGDKPASAPAKEAAAKFDWTTADVTEDNVKKALAGASGGLTLKLADHVKSIEIHDHAGTPVADDKMIHVKLSKKNGLDEKGLAKTMSDTMIAYSEILFANPKVEEVNVWVSTEFTDQGGKKSESNAIRIGWKRATHDKVDYAEFKKMATADYTRTYALADSYYFHPGLFAGLDDKKDLKASK